MTPTLSGRIQSRICLAATVGVVWTALIAFLVPNPDGASLLDRYRALFTALLIVTVVGVVWELAYHLAQQFRWEKDWPTLFGLITAIPEGVVTWILIQAGLPWDVGPVAASTFLVMFVTLWLLIWAVANGPLQIVLLRWRFQGGRFFGGW